LVESRVGHVVRSSGANASLTVTATTVKVGLTSTFTAIIMAGSSATATVTATTIQAGVTGTNVYAIFLSGTSSTLTASGSAIAASTLNHAIRCDATTNGVIFQGDMTDSLNGAKAIYTRIFRMTATNSGTTTYTNTVGYPTGTPVTRVSPDNVTGMAQEADVRLNTIYGFNSELEGTLAVPPATAVGSGVPVDNTTGTASLSPADVAALVGAQIAAAVSSP
jgi:hypothetical protein